MDISDNLEINEYLEMASTPVSTPTKVSQNVTISPQTKSKTCILCNRKEELSTFRRTLYRYLQKTDVCMKIERVLNVEIDFHMNTDIVCRTCVRAVERLEKSKDQIINLEKDNEIQRTQLVTNFRNSVALIRKRYGQNISKRLLNSPASLENKENRQKVTKRRRDLMKDFVPDDGGQQVKVLQQSNQIPKLHKNAGVHCEESPVWSRVVVRMNMCTIIHR